MDRASRFIIRNTSSIGVDDVIYDDAGVLRSEVIVDAAHNSLLIYKPFSFEVDVDVRQDKLHDAADVTSIFNPRSKVFEYGDENGLRF